MIIDISVLFSKPLLRITAVGEESDATIDGYPSSSHYWTKLFGFMRRNLLYHVLVNLEYPDELNELIYK